MGLEVLTIVVSGIGLFCGGIAAFIGLTIKAQMASVDAKISDVRREVADWKSDAYKHRSTDRDELRNWINGSFMRAKEVVRKWQETDRRIERLEDDRPGESKSRIER